MWKDKRSLRENRESLRYVNIGFCLGIADLFVAASVWLALPAERRHYAK
jgi:hypothetical protein